MAGGIAASIVAFSVGAVLDFAVTVGPDQHGFNIHNVGVILMIVGAVGVVLSQLHCSPEAGLVGIVRVSMTARGT